MMRRLRAIHGGVLLLTLACAAMVSTLTLTQTVDGLFDSDSLYRMDLIVESRDWDTLKARFLDDDYYPADLRWNGVTVRRVGIRSRGLGSRSGRKPGLRVDMNRYTAGQTFLGLGSLVLDNLAQDGSGLHERVAMRFYDRMGLPAPREAHVRLYVNNRYAGLYAVVESIDKDFLRRVFGRNGSGVENDGYLFEYEWTDEWPFTYRGPDLNAYRALLDPVTHENAPPDELYAPIDQMLRAINETPDAEFTSAVGRYLDLPLFMRHVAAQNVIAQFDGIAGYAGVNNFYLYRFEDSVRSQFILWDEDNAFRAPDFPILEGHDQNVLVRRAMRVPELRAAYFDSLLEAAAIASEPTSSPGIGWLEREIRQQRSLIEQSMREDTLKPFTNEEFDGWVQHMLAVARLRPAFVRGQVARFVSLEAGVPR
ncbi:MAG: hypothetical protein HW394_1534 [Acidobacteria bacterium]|nr:hypothetical protein [Acidobacteriota bacterium]